MDDPVLDFTSSMWGNGFDGFCRRLNQAERRMREEPRLVTRENRAKLALWRRQWHQFQDRLHEEREAAGEPTLCCGRCKAFEDFMATRDPIVNNVKPLVDYITSHACHSLSNCRSWIAQRAMDEEEWNVALNGTPEYQAQVKANVRKQKERRIARRNVRQAASAASEPWNNERGRKRRPEHDLQTGSGDGDPGGPHPAGEDVLF